MIGPFFRLLAILVVLVVAVPISVPGQAADGPALFRVDGGPGVEPGVDSGTVYLFGTFHLMKPGVNWQRAAVLDALAASDDLTLELAPEEMDPAKITPIVMRKGMLTDGTTLISRLDEPAATQLRESAAATGLPLAFLNRLRPWYAAMVLAIQHAQASGFSPALGAEVRFTALAGKAGKPINGLETAAVQMALFADMDPDLEVQLLIGTLEELPQLEGQWDALAAAWLGGDLDQLDALMSASMRRVPALYDRVLRHRNETWIAPIEVMLRNPGTHFVAVGAAHLAGPDSVVLMLEQRGWQVTRE